MIFFFFPPSCSSLSFFNLYDYQGTHLDFFLILLYLDLSVELSKSFLMHIQMIIDRGLGIPYEFKFNCIHLMSNLSHWEIGFDNLHVSYNCLADGVHDQFFYLVFCLHLLGLHILQARLSPIS